MCIFSGVDAVKVVGTRIFGRCSGDEQLLAYDMQFASRGDVAMVLPLPVAPGLGEAAVRFIDLSSYRRLFDDLAELFWRDEEYQMSSRAAPRGKPQPLVVHAVGEFEASFVPALADFARLDERFRVAPGVWDALPAYRDWGFAVFKLRSPDPVPPRPGLVSRMLGRAQPVAPPRRVHPMALAFRTRSPDRVYFPTTHVHDGAVHARAEFDHELYLQLPAAPAEGWEAADPVRIPNQASSRRLDSKRSKGVLADAVPVFRRVMHGKYENADIYAA